MLGTSWCRWRRRQGLTSCCPGISAPDPGHSHSVGTQLSSVMRRPGLFTYTWVNVSTSICYIHNKLRNLFQVVFVLSIIFTSGSVKISDDNGVGMPSQLVTDHARRAQVRVNQEKSKQMSKLISKMRHFENVQNNTIIISGKFNRENEKKTVGDETEWQPVNIEKENNIMISNSKKKTIEEVKVKNHVKEKNKISPLFDKRPSFHVIDVGDFSQDFLNSKESRSIENNYRKVRLSDQELEKSARFNIDEELAFPNFETQFFGSFGELSSHKPALHFPSPDNYHSHEDGDYHEEGRPYPPPPKKGVLNFHKNPKVTGQYATVKPSQDVSALYVDDPWKHIDEVNSDIYGIVRMIIQGFHKKKAEREKCFSSEGFY